MLRRALLRVYRIPRRPALPGPPAHGLDVEDVSFPAVDGLGLRGWLVRQPATTGPRPAIVILHGWGSSAAQLLPIAAPLRDLGAHVLLLDARGHGRSDRVDFMSMPRFAEDVEQAVSWLRARSDVDPDRVALLGHSVGAGACLLAASHDPRIAGVVSVASMAHPADLMRRTLHRRLPGFGVRAVLRIIEETIGHRFEDFAPVRTIGLVRAPILVLHGLEDARVPVEDAERLVEAGGERVECVLVPDAHHESVEAFLATIPRVGLFLLAALGLPEPSDLEF